MEMAGIHLWIVLLIIAGQLPRPKAQLSYSIELETALRDSLYQNYSVMQRPASTVQVMVTLNLLYINGLDIKSQTMSTSGYFTLQWRDERLDWNTNPTYDSVTFLFSSQRTTWRPTIVIENSNTDLKIFSDADSLIRNRPDGLLTWNPGGMFETHCDADVTYYPIDSQECSIVVTTWAYTLLEVSLQLNPEPFGMDNFKENGEWEIISTSTYRESVFRAGDVTNSFSRLYFNFKLRRRPLFHILNTLFPVILMASLICFVFKLPPESGERVGMSLTVLLAYAVYLTLISENIPQTSLRASILSTYLTIILILSALSVVSTIVVLDIYFNHEDDEDVPIWIQFVTKHVLIRITCWKGSCCKRKAKPKDGVTSVVDMDSAKGGKTLKSNPPKKAFDVRSEQSTSTDCDDDEEIMLSWKEIALILDKSLMYMFIAMVMICTGVCLALLASQY